MKKPTPEKGDSSRSRKPNYGDAIRLVRIVLGLHDRPRGWVLERIHEDLGVSPRTVTRYLRALREELVDSEGRPLIEIVRYDSQRVLRWRNPARPPEASVYEAASLHFVLASLRCLEGTVLWDGVSGLLERILENLTREQQERLAHLDRKLTARGRAGSRVYAEHDDQIDLLLRALIGGHRVRICYRDGEGANDRTFDPYTLACGCHGLELTGHCHVERKVVTLAVRRILEVEEVRDADGGRQRFRYPRDYDPSRYLGAPGARSPATPAAHGRIVPKRPLACGPRRPKDTTESGVEGVEAPRLARGSGRGE